MLDLKYFREEGSLQEARLFGRWWNLPTPSKNFRSLVARTGLEKVRSISPFCVLPFPFGRLLVALHGRSVTLNGAFFETCLRATSTSKFIRQSNGTVLLLERGDGPLGLTATTKPECEAAVSVMQRGTIVDGEAFGIDASLDDVAKDFAEDLQQIVVNHTRIQGSYDFHVLPFDKDNTDLEFAVKGVAKKLGSGLEEGKRYIRLVAD